MPFHYLITGATGFVGGHLAEACVARGIPVSAIVRPGSNTSLLSSLGVNLYRGNLDDEAVLGQALANADVVVNCAARVGDGGPLEDYRPINVEALKHLYAVLKSIKLHRFIQMSSLGVYEPRHHYGTRETDSLPVLHWDAYTQTKVEAENLIQGWISARDIPATILRPGFVYGPRDRTVLPKLIDRLKSGQMRYLGGEKTLLNCIYVKNLVEAVFLAVDRPQSLGQVYNLTDGEKVTKQMFVEAIAVGIGAVKPKQVLPYWLAGLLARILRKQIQRAGINGKPWMTAAQYKFLLLNLDFNIDKARHELGYQPTFSFDQAMKETMAWYRSNS